MAQRRLTVRYVLGHVVNNSFVPADEEGIVFNDSGYTLAGFEGAKTEESILLAIASVKGWKGSIRPFSAS
jgi:hypothetical protein